MRGTGVAAVRVAKKLRPGHRIVTILYDSSTQHLSKFWAESMDDGGEESRVTLEDVVGRDS